MESEITLKSVDWKEGTRKDGKPWKMLMLKDTGDLIYSAFSNQISGEALELVNKLKAGDALKIAYEMARTKDGKEVRNLKGIIEYEPEVAPAESKRQDTGRSKDEMIAYQVALKAAVELRKEDTAVIEADVLKTARIFLDFLMGNDERFPGEEG